MKQNNVINSFEGFDEKRLFRLLQSSKGYPKERDFEFELKKMSRRHEYLD